MPRSRLFKLVFWEIVAEANPWNCLPRKKLTLKPPDINFLRNSFLNALLLSFVLLNAVMVNVQSNNNSFSFWIVWANCAIVCTCVSWDIASLNLPLLLRVSNSTTALSILLTALSFDTGLIFKTTFVLSILNISAPHALPTKSG